MPPKPKPPRHPLSTAIKLPKTDFPPRPPHPSPFLPEVTDNLYAWQNENRSRHLVLHDGPPYANGPLHLGHALNKILKDFVCRVGIKNGRRIQYVPGWDCHGLPIEVKALQSLRKEERQDPVRVRNEARKFACNAMEMQKAGFKSWGVMGDWDKAYLTMEKEYGLRQLELWKDMVSKGLVTRARRPVYWSASSRTALAEAELEYKDMEAKTATIWIPVQLPEGILTKLETGEDLTSQMGVLVWTTTPWTLPANRAIAYSRHHSYDVVRLQGQGHSKCALVAHDCLANLTQDMEAAGYTIHLVASNVRLSGLENATYKHPLRENLVQPLLHADFVQSGVGTGFVHIAPGHGFDDYLLGKIHRLEVAAPVDDQGRYTAQALPEEPDKLLNVDVLSGGSKIILEMLSTSLPNRPCVISTAVVSHRYPVDWRTKKPVVIRATSQWFAAVDSIKEDANRALEKVKFVPESGKSRLQAFVNSRSEWCVSRQRAWGMPIPALYRTDTANEEAVMTVESISHIQAVIKERGTDAWWSDDASDPAWIPEYLEGTYRRGTDTMDVWFDSGSSWTMLDKIHSPPADVYIEGSDQHRGWFQSSLLTHVASQHSETETINPPFGTLITHGFALDEAGKKMSKSLGNVVDPQEIVEGRAFASKGLDANSKKCGSLGADGLRYWLASIDYTKDFQVSPAVILQSNGLLIKLRNTFKYLLGNLHEFEFLDGAARNDYELVDQVLLLRLHQESNEIQEAFEQHAFHRGIARLNNFVKEDLSEFYFEVAKDRLYTGRQWDRYHTRVVLSQVLHELLDVVAPIAPLLVQEIWSHMPQNLMSTPNALQREWKRKEIDHTFDFAAKSHGFFWTAKRLFGPIENALRADGTIKSSLELAVNVTVDHGSPERTVVDEILTRMNGPPLAGVLGVSSSGNKIGEVGSGSKVVGEIEESIEDWIWEAGKIGQPVESKLRIQVRTMTEEETKCVRCWKHLVPTVESEKALCTRCTDVVSTQRPDVWREHAQGVAQAT